MIEDVNVTMDEIDRMCDIEHLDFISLVEVVDESAATAVLERLNALVALSAFLGGEGIGEPGWGGERDGAEAAHTTRGCSLL